MYSESRDKQINYYLKLSGTILIIVFAIFTIAISGSISSFLSNISPSKTITVSGYSEMNATPDIRTLSINIIGKGATEKLAQNDAGVKSKEVSDSLKTYKVSDADIKNQNLSTYPEYKSDCPVETYSGAYRPCNQNSVISGYNTTQSIEVTLRGDLMNKAGDIVADLTGKGVTVQTGEASIENPEKLKNDLRAKAITDARANAEKLANALGVSLGKVQSFTENSGGYYPMAKMEAMSASSNDAVTPPVISNGSQKVSSTVSVSFEIR